MSLSTYSATDFLNSNASDGQTIERKQLLTFVNAGTSETPIWQWVGDGVEDSAVNYNPTVTTKTDIRGVTQTTVDEMPMSQSLGTTRVKKGSKLHFKLDDILQRHARSELALFEVLLVRAYLEETETSGSGNEATTITHYHAEKHTGCTIVPGSLGGSAFVDMDIEIQFSNNFQVGTVTSLTSPVFAPLTTQPAAAQPYTAT